jgi:hypothetical protein
VIAPGAGQLMVNAVAGESGMTEDVTLCWGDPASVTLTLTLYWPAVVGTPPIAPLAVFRVTPGGRVPLAMANV